MFGHPGKKLMFMGCEFGQWREWNHDVGLDWHLLNDPLHQGLKRWVQDLNQAYLREAPLHQLDHEGGGFRWIDCNDNENSVISFIRRARDPRDFMVVVVNFTPVPRTGYQIGVPEGGWYREILNSDGAIYGGSDVGNQGGVMAEPLRAHGCEHSLRLAVPPLAVVMFRK
jgi:1,4-alpha-glucan branching enzyme